MVELEICPICKREINSNHITIHHVKPKSKGGTIQDTIRICKSCHDAIHYYIDIEDVYEFDTVQKLINHPEYKEYVNWIRKLKHSAWCPIKKIKRVLQLAK